MSEFHKLERKGSSLFITCKRSFSPNAKSFKKETIKRVFDFAYDMTFGDLGEHRNHRSGGTNQRKQGEIFANTFQGKLAECAACNLFYKVDNSVMPDFSVSKLGVWDSVDINVKGKNIAVKSTKSYGNLLLLEQYDWDCNGCYLPNKNTDVSLYDYFLLVRINPFCEDIMRKYRWLYSNQIEKKELWNAIENNIWTYDFAGYIALEHLQQIIRDELIIQKGDLLNGTTRMDADNYYIQSGDMFEVHTLLEELSMADLLPEQNCPLCENNSSKAERGIINTLKKLLHSKKQK